jgi:biopolymer transport protein ExbB
VLDFFITGGVFMIPLVLCSIVSVAIILLRAFALRERKVLPPMIEHEIEQLPPNTPPEKLARLVYGNPSPLARIVLVAIGNLRRTKADNIEAVQIRARQEMLHLESGLVVLELIVGLGPLLGLLGAVSGLVGVFGSLGTAGAGSDPAGVAKGIAEALHTTIMGLAVAIPSLVAHSYFTKKVEVFAVQMEALVSELLSKCYGHDVTKPSPVAIDHPAQASPPPVDFALSRAQASPASRSNTRKGQPISSRAASENPQKGFSYPHPSQSHPSSPR